MNTIRAFIAVEIDEPNKETIGDIITQLKKSEAIVKWVTKPQLHFTLKFLGKVEETKIQNIVKSLNLIAKDFRSFSIRFSEIGGFPNIARPRVIWLGIDKGQESLIELNNEIENVMGYLGFRKERRNYRPHLTLGRVKSLKNISNLTKLIKETNLKRRDPFGSFSLSMTKIDKLALFQSTLTAKGAVYTIISERYLTNSST